MFFSGSSAKVAPWFTPEGRRGKKRARSMAPQIPGKVRQTLELNRGMLKEIQRDMEKVLYLSWEK